MSLKFCALASGSKGNCSFVSDGHTDILIDLGISAARAEKCLRILGADPDGINILITHSHADHIGGLKTFCKRHPRAKVVCQRECAYRIARAENVSPITAGRSFIVGTLTVTAIPVSHDVPCFGYVISDGFKRVAVVTDIGVVAGEQLSALGTCDIVMLECNHDTAKLGANPRYTPMLKARIASERGHLSNADCAAACAYLASNGVKNFILAHLSEENNDPALAVSIVESYVRDAGVAGVHIIAAKQDSMTGLFEVC